MTGVVPPPSLTPLPEFPSVTVGVLTWNGEKYLTALLQAVQAQNYGGEVEVLVIDSGSTDQTLAILQEYPVRLVQIPQTDFGHGRTRNYLATLARGELILYLTHDAVPAGADWISAYVAAFRKHPQVVAAYGKQIPRPDAPPIVKYDVHRVFTRLEGETSEPRVYTQADPLHLAGFYSDANSAVRRDLILNHLPYRDVDYAEDQWLGLDLYHGGYAKAYVPGAAVWHSNDTTWADFPRRVRADLQGLHGTELAPPRLTWWGAALRAVKWSLIDAAAICHDPDYSGLQKLRFQIINPAYQWRKWREHTRPIDRY